MQPIINRTVLMSSAAHFDNGQAINPFMSTGEVVDVTKAQSEHDRIRQALESAGVKVVQVEAPAGCQDGVYTANWALVRGNKAVMSRLPNARSAEEPYARQVLRDLGKEIITVPDGLRFSGQGDALPCGNYLFAGSQYRTDAAVHDFLKQALGYDVISLQTVPLLDAEGHPVINTFSGWPDSFYYDIDLAISILRWPADNQPGLIAWCPDAFTQSSQTRIRGLTDIDKIEVSLAEAQEAFACNLVSTGETVIMSAHAPQFLAAVEAHGLKTITPEISELSKGGGYIRCTTLTLDNE